MGVLEEASPMITDGLNASWFTYLLPIAFSQKFCMHTQCEGVTQLIASSSCQMTEQQEHILSLGMNLQMLKGNTRRCFCGQMPVHDLHVPEEHLLFCPASVL